MKTKFFKIGLPIMVFMMAIVFAFASNTTTKVEDTSLALVEGYILQNGECKFVTRCSTKSGPLCVVGGVTLRTKINETQCGVQLYHWNN